MIPLKNLSPRDSFPTVTFGLIIANIVVFVHQLTLSDRAAAIFINTYGMVPAHLQMALAGHRYTLEQAIIPLFTSMFIHGGFLHIIGNMWFLWIFGGQVEDRLGHLYYLLFYTICGLGSGVTQLAFDWGSKVPAIGASGAIAGVLGAYILFFPSSQILTLIPLFIIWFTARIPAVIFVGLWFILQFLSGIGSLGAANTGGVAWWAHVGGFLLGLFLAKGKKPTRRPAYNYGD